MAGRWVLRRTIAVSPRAGVAARRLTWGSSKRAGVNALGLGMGSYLLGCSHLSMQTCLNVDREIDATTGGGLEQFRQLHEGTERFGTERELATLAAKWPTSRLHEIWNAFPGTQLVRKFTDRKTAVRRIWNEAQKLNPFQTQRSAQVRRPTRFWLSCGNPPAPPSTPSSRLPVGRRTACAAS